jgi:hypothetical protein
MVKMPVCLVRRSVKTSRNIEVENFLIHAAKVWKDFLFRKQDFTFLKWKKYDARNLKFQRSKPAGK